MKVDHGSSMCGAADHEARLPGSYVPTCMSLGKEILSQMAEWLQTWHTASTLLPLGSIRKAA